MFDYEGLPPLDTSRTMFSLKDRTALLFGGAGQMGKQFARILIGAGARVVLTDVNAQSCTNLASTLGAETGGHILGLKCDTSSCDDITNVISRTMSEFGSLDILIYNVMAKPSRYYAPFDEYDTETWDEVLAGNLRGAFHCCQEALEPLKYSTHASIILTSSTYGVVGPDPDLYEDLPETVNLYDQAFPLNTPLAYSVSKAGLIGMVKHLAIMLGKHNIRVNALTPGGVYDGHDDTFEERYSRRTALGRMATWSDYNGAIIFLASDASRYMTGSNLIIDAGWTAR